jgi:uncharacterized protein
MTEWRNHIIDGREGIQRILRESRRIAILGIKTEAQSGQPAFWVAEYLKNAGYEIIPVPVYYPDATRILGEDVHRRVTDVPKPLDLVLVFRKSQDVAQHLDDLLAARPSAVWMQSGIRNDAVARQLAESGIDVVQNRCAMIEHRVLR